MGSWFHGLIGLGIASYLDHLISEDWLVVEGMYAGEYGAGMKEFFFSQLSPSNHDFQ